MKRTQKIMQNKKIITEDSVKTLIKIYIDRLLCIKEIK